MARFTALVLVCLVAGCSSSNGGSSPSVGSGSDAAPPVTTSDGAAPVGNDAAGGGSMVGSDAAAPPLAKADPVRVRVCSDGEKINCAKLDQCYPAHMRLILGYADLADCQARAPTGCLDQPAIPSSTTTEAQLDACLKAEMALSCDDYFNNAAVPACDFKGPKAVGASCASDEQCATGHCGDDPAAAGGTCGRCAAYLTEGMGCATGGKCGPGLFCNGRSCIKLGTAGAPCDAVSLCGYGLYCAAGKCAPQVAMVGAACTPPRAPTDANSCSDAMDMYCDQTTSKCVAWTYLPVGSPCGRATPPCQGGSGCLITVMGSATGTCQPFQSEGQQCDRNRPCTPPFQCVGDTPNAQFGTCVLGQAVDPGICE